MNAEEWPNGWAHVALEELAQFALGGDWGEAPEIEVPESRLVSCIRAAELRNWSTEKGQTAELRRLTKSSIERRSLLEGDLLIEISGGGPEQPVGRVVMIDKECLSHSPDRPKVCTNFFRLIRLSTSISPNFIATYLRYFYATGKTVPLQGGSNNLRNLKFPGYFTQSVPLPPLNEQKRIVAKIEELFTKLDKGIESLRDAQAQLKLYRQASIDFALRNLEGIELISTCLGDVIGAIDQGWSPKCDYNSQPEPDQWAVITTTAVQPQKYLPNECKPLPAGLEPRQKIEVQQGDILMTRKGPRKRTGVVCRVREYRARSMLCDTVYRFRANEDIICPDFLEILLNSPSVLAQIDRLKAGISDSGISLNQGKVKSVELTIPREIEAQREIYARVQTIEDSIVRVEIEIETQLAKADALRQSILKQAFSGKLVPQDPNDEPASTLLERIRAERAEAKPPKRQTRPRKAKEAA